VKLAVTPDLFMTSPSGYYRSVRPSDELTHSSTPRLRLMAAGVIALIHIVWTNCGPDPISPFLLFIILTENISDIVDQPLIKWLDEGDREVEFFACLDKVEERRRQGQTMVLEPLKNLLGIYKELQVSV
jgi:hypothetical protein